MAVLFLNEALRALEDRPLPYFDEYSANLAQAREQHGTFNEYALREVRGRPWFARWRIVMWARRRLRQLWGRLR
jgi:hypothetical protein